jgi:hypothetical protein
MRTDDLIDHRPYIPGDDPRRINWKLYSHGPANSLFVREGETEPPPHSELLILVDTETDPALYSREQGRAAVDLLCEQALAIALDFASRGMDVLVGYTSGALTGGDGEDLARAMAGPASIMRGGRRGPPLGGAEDLPMADRGTCILALPRTNGETGALDRFLARRAGLGVADGAAPSGSNGPARPSGVSSAPCEIIFIYPAPETGKGRTRRGVAAQEAAVAVAAETCARLYNACNGVHAEAFAHGGSYTGGQA